MKQKRKSKRSITNTLSKSKPKKLEAGYWYSFRKRDFYKDKDLKYCAEFWENFLKKSKNKMFLLKVEPTLGFDNAKELKLWFEGLEGTANISRKDYFYFKRLNKERDLEKAENILALREIEKSEREQDG